MPILLPAFLNGPMVAVVPYLYRNVVCHRKLGFLPAEEAQRFNVGALRRLLTVKVGKVLWSAVGTRAVAEISSRPSGDVPLHPLPVTAVVPNFLAVGADGQ
jgi:hypothetical protein